MKRLYDYDLPQSTTTIMKDVHEFSDQKKEEVKEILRVALGNGIRFSLSFDEWSSRRGRRYCNINLHASDNKFCLGVVRVFGSLTSEKTQQILRDTLETFGLSLDKHIVAAICDGARVNLRFGRENPTELQVCLAHGIHLAVTEVLYKKTNDIENDLFPDENYEDSSDIEVPSSDDEDCNEDDPVDFSSEDASVSVNGVRKIVKFFKRSDLKNQTLQDLVKVEFGHEITLKLDCRTR